MAETLVGGTRVSDVARRWQLHPQQLFGWRHQARKGSALKRAAVTEDTEPSFVPLVAASYGGAEPGDIAASRSSIEIELAGALVRVTDGVDGEWLTAVLRAVRRSSGRP